MSYGKMNTFIEIIKPTVTIDTEGFSAHSETTAANIRAYREGRHGSRIWANRAAFTEATDLFRFRVIPDVEITTDMLIVTDGHRFGITSVEDVKGRGMYIEVLCKEVKPSRPANAGKGEDSETE